MSASIEEIVDTAINKIVLKCHVKPHNHTPLATSKVAQKVTLLSPSLPNDDGRLAADRLLSRANSEYSSGAYAAALKEYESAAEIYSRVKSKQYYAVLGRMGECQRRLRNIAEARKLYEESSLVYTGSFWSQSLAVSREEGMGEWRNRAIGALGLWDWLWGVGIEASYRNGLWCEGGWL